VSSLLKEGENILEVFINSTAEYDKEGQKNDHMPFDYAHTRKACYQYSWDWAPYLNTMGIWKGVYIESFESLQIDYVWARNRYIS
jgi:beta-mannosidase